MTNALDYVGEGSVAPLSVAKEFKEFLHNTTGFKWEQSSNFLARAHYDTTSLEDDAHFKARPHAFMGALNNIEPLVAQSLPCEVEVDSKGKPRITSLINGVPYAENVSFYDTITQLIGSSLKPWADVLLQHGEKKKTYRVVPHDVSRFLAPDFDDMEPADIGPFATGAYPQSGDLSSYDEWWQKNKPQRESSVNFANQNLQVIVEVSSVELASPQVFTLYVA